MTMLRGAAIAPSIFGACTQTPRLRPPDYDWSRLASSLLRAERRAIHLGLQPPFLSRAERGDILRQGGPGFERPVQTPR